MKKLLKSIFTLFLFHLVLLRGYSNANSLFLGNIGSVYPDGAINAMKNPALVAAQEEKNSFGLLFNYRTFIRVDADFNFDFLSNEKTENEIEKQAAGGAGIIFTKRINKHGFGIGLSDSDDSLYSYKKDKTTITGLGSSSEVLSIKTEGKEKIINPELNLCYGLQFGNKSFLGLRLIESGKKTDTETETTESLTSGSTTVSSSKTSHEISTISSWELIFGFYYTDKGSQLGLMVNTGRLSIVESEIDYHDESLIDPDGSNSYSKHRQYDEGASIMAGGYTRLLPFLGIALEGGFQLPAYYNEKNYDDKTYEVNETAVSQNSVMVFKGGLDFILSSQLRFAMGGVAFLGKYSSEKNFNGSTRSKSDFKGFSYMAGFDYLSQGGIRFMAGAVVNRYKMDGNSKSEDGTSSMMIEMKSGLLELKTFFGIMFNF